MKREVGGSRSIRIDISGPSREAVLPFAFRVNERLAELFPRTEGNQVRALPNLDNGAPQIRITPDLASLARAGVSVREPEIHGQRGNILGDTSKRMGLWCLKRNNPSPVAF